MLHKDDDKGQGAHSNAGKTRIIVQDCIRRGHDLAAAAANLGAQFTQLPDRVTADDLRAIEESVLAAGEKPILFGSLQLAARVRVRHPALARGIGLNLEALRHSRYSALLPQEMLLNPGGVYLPWSRLVSNKDMLAQLFGQRLFLRPDRATKPFPGFDVGIEDLEAEIRARRQTDHVEPGELVFVAPFRDLPRVEFRVWLVEGEIVSASAYSWHHDQDLLAVPDVVLEAARKVAAPLEGHLPDLTADFVVIDGEALLVEVNGLPTSGWYPGAEPLRILAALDQVYAGPGAAASD